MMYLVAVKVATVCFGAQGSFMVRFQGFVCGVLGGREIVSVVLGMVWYASRDLFVVYLVAEELFMVCLVAHELFMVFLVAERAV